MQVKVPILAVHEGSSTKLAFSEANQEIPLLPSNLRQATKTCSPTMLSEVVSAAVPSTNGNSKSKQKTLLLDLDDTLITAISYKTKIEELGNTREKRRHNFQVCFFSEGKPQVYYVYERPGLRDFLKKVTCIFEV